VRYAHTIRWLAHAAARLFELRVLRVTEPEESIPDRQTLIRLGLLITRACDRKRMLRLSPENPPLFKVWFDKYWVAQPRHAHALPYELMREFPGINLIEADGGGDDMPSWRGSGPLTAPIPDASEQRLDANFDRPGRPKENFQWLLDCRHFH
jgi:hypothetical protein